MREQTRVFILHNEITPYRLPIFEQLSKRFNVHVYFCTQKSPERLWDTDIVNRYSFKWSVLPNFKIGEFVINPTVLFEAVKDWDVYLISEGYDIGLSVILSIIGAKIKQKPIVLWTEHIDTPHSKRQESVTKRILKRIYELLIYSQATIFVGYSKKSKLFLINRNIPSSKIIFGSQVMPFSLICRDKDKDKKSDKNLKTIKIDTSKFKRFVTYIGYFRKPKGIQLLIKAFKKITIRDTALILAGAGPYEKELRRIAEKDKRIFFIGYVDGQKKSTIYSLATVFVLPTFHDAWGLVINEALYFGVPVITTTAAGGSQIIINGKNGFVVPPEDENALKRSIETLLENPKLQRKMSKIARRYGEKYTDPKVGAEPFIKALNTLVRFS